MNWLKQRKNLAWASDEAFYIAEEVLAHFRTCVEQGERQEAQWSELKTAYVAANAEQANEFDRVLAGELTANWDADIPVFDPEDKAIATRAASGKSIKWHI